MIVTKTPITTIKVFRKTKKITENNTKMSKQMHQMDAQTKSFDCIMLTLQKINKIHIQTIPTQRITTKQQRLQQS